MPPEAVQERGSQYSRELVAEAVGAKPGTVVVVVGGVDVVVVPLAEGEVVVVVTFAGGAAMVKCVPVTSVTAAGLLGS